MKVIIPSPLRPHTRNKAEVSVDGTTVADVLASLIREYPDLRRSLFSDDGHIRKFVNVYVNADDIRHLPKKEQTVLRADDVISIIPSVAGG